MKSIRDTDVIDAIHHYSTLEFLRLDFIRKEPIRMNPSNLGQHALMKRTTAVPSNPALARHPVTGNLMLWSKQATAESNSTFADNKVNENENVNESLLEHMDEGFGNIES